jgi:alpha-maltose-1-phosphate synthase
LNVLLVHPGTQHSFRLAAELAARGVLGGFYTGTAFIDGGWIDRASQWLPMKWRRKLASRRLREVPRERLHIRPMTEMTALLRLRRGGDDQQVWHRRAEVFQQSIPDFALAASSAAIGFDTSSWILAERCRQIAVPFILDQSIGHPDSKLPLYALAREQYPAWNDGIDERRPEVRAAERQEHDGATRVVSASSFTSRSLVDHGVDPAKIRLIPYGVDFERFVFQPRTDSRPTRFIFVGFLNARKGVPLVLEAWQKLHASGAELWLVGRMSPAVRHLLPDLPGIRYFGAVPQDEVSRLMQQCDVFVFPSYFEGFGLVLLEAMACGLPVITTTATAGPDLVTEGENGWVFEPGDLERLTESMTYCLEHNGELAEMGRQARATAEQFTWSSYGDRWLQLLGEVCN